MELRQLRYFAAVCRTGTFRAAAEEQHVAQPALWQQVRALERECGVRLFERQGRNVRVTGSGRQLLQRAENTLESAKRFGELAEDLRRGRAGTIIIATPAPAVQHTLASLIASFRAQNPAIRVIIAESYGAGEPSTGQAPSSIEALRGGVADFAVGRHQEGLPGVRLYDVRVVAVGAGGKRKLPISKLKDVPLLVAPEGYFSRMSLEREARRSGFEPMIELESRTPTMLVALAERGTGIAILADDSLSRETPHRPLIARDGVELSSEIWIHWRSEAADPAVQRFVAMLGDLGAG